ncbi:MAG: hypothetical protein IPJ64_03805 [Saprospiraceae bacterium]|nr:hypothetical protein [Saprospiraceae bacterium]MBK7795481.1 hypothetical protein [Saprospiraceae bacterium]
MDFLNDTIHPFLGTKNFRVGAHMYILNNFLKNISIENRKIELTYNQIFITLYNAVTVSINISTGCIFSISFFGIYSGKTIHGIGIGSKVKDLFKTGFTICTDDDAILMGEKCEAPFKYIFYINNEGLFIQNINDVLEHEITAIVTELPLYDLELTDSV